MKFDRVPLDVAEGAILAHRVQVPGSVLKKGSVLTAEDVTALRAAKLEAVTAARLEEHDVREDDGALAVARAACGNGLSLGAAFTGRCNLFAEVRGLAVFDRERLDQCNLVDEAVTIATLPAYELVEAGGLVATVKIIPLAVHRDVIEACAAVAGTPSALLRIAVFKAIAVGLIQTRMPGIKEGILDKAVETLHGRLTALEGTLAREVRCSHDEDEVAAAIRTLWQSGVSLILILGASATIDRRDVVPGGITRAGGTIDHFGMPVDPGNLTLLAHCGTVPVIGLPGSARSPRIHGFDWLLRRLAADITVSGRDIMLMGAGGLLKEIPQRPLPRAKASPRAHKSAPVRQPPRVAAVILAAGQSRRMGRDNKLLREVDGVPMVIRVVAAVSASRARPVIVVTGHQEAEVRAALAGANVTFVHNPDFAEGLSTSLRSGLAALPAEVTGAVICLGDMPRVSAALVDRLIGAFDPAEGRAICVPTHRGKRGNPVLWAARYFGEMGAIAGDVGARHLIGEHAEAVCEVDWGDDAVLVDINTPEALARFGNVGDK